VHQHLQRTAQDWTSICAVIGCVAYTHTIEPLIAANCTCLQNQHSDAAGECWWFKCPMQSD